MTKKFVSYDDIQEALRLTAEAETKTQVASGQEVTARSAALRLVENFAASLKHVCIQTAQPFKGQAWVDMSITHAERAAELLHVARLTNDATQRAAALRDAHEHLDESRKMAMHAAVRVQEQLREHPGKAVKLGDDFDIKPKVPTL